MSYIGKLGFIIVFFSLGTAHAKVYGKFMVVKRDVKVLRSDGKSQNAKVSLSVFPGDTVVTGKDSRAKIVMMDRNIIHVSPDTSLKIAKYVNDKTHKSVELELNEGKVRNNVENSYDGDKDKFIIKTPTAVAGVRGTQFITSYNKSNKLTQVVTLKGVVELRNIGGGANQKPSIVTIKKGESSSVSENQNPLPPKPVPKQQMQKMDKESSGFTPEPKRDSRKDTTKDGDSKKESGGDKGAQGPGKPIAGGSDSKSPDTLESSPGITSGIKTPDALKKRPAFEPPRPVTRDLPADVIRNKNNKTRVIIQPKTPGN